MTYRPGADEYKMTGRPSQAGLQVIIDFWYYGLCFDLLVFRDEGLHYAPRYKVGYCAPAEYYHIAGCLAFESEELESGPCSL